MSLDNFRIVTLVLKLQHAHIVAVEKKKKFLKNSYFLDRTKTITPSSKKKLKTINISKSAIFCQHFHLKIQHRIEKIHVSCYTEYFRQDVKKKLLAGAHGCKLLENPDCAINIGMDYNNRIHLIQTVFGDIQSI